MKLFAGDSNQFKSISKEHNIKYIDRNPNTATNEAKADENEIILNT